MRIVLGVEYDGSAFFGWQWQDGGLRTVQAAVQFAASKVANHAVTIICTGRTDTGVHALEQVVHFDTRAERSHHSWLLGINANLPDDVRVIWIQETLEGFHARYSAIARFYRYIILNRDTRSALQRDRVTWCHQYLDAESMHQAAQALVGTYDFTSFRALKCQSVSPMRLMYFIDVYRQDEQVIMDISANAFLHHMVRNIAGVLIAIGSGEKPVAWAEELLASKNRQKGGVTAPAHGLYLAGVYYPEKYALPKHSIFNKLPATAQRFQHEKQL
ncbi:MAG TPA: tRNA pseudouridine(38-40) synthase TruA [Methyloprofundus sp.]|uniref:tRNA pseudouridine(38-40) synthase TruA n=1 Tax=Methyloprofundus sp. TaxID=2020875 RepID=UPI001827A46F|nr:tRNA pseudouridine(38-40) synthase TruA [Methyloprofundus sp.]HIG64707.1 tRNA pseudouridine(38-40) synthase TruA [Methyloprofundus sp.]HIL79612.1 tRNA pseudouridine(38-40) synthase TruA [Methylococcales bacterium]